MSKWIVPTLFALCSTALAQGEWKLSLESSLTTTLNLYSTNWTGKETGALSWTAQMVAIAERQLTERLHNSHTLRLAFGQTVTQDADRSGWADPVKSTDLVDYVGLLKFTLNGGVDPYVSLRTVSQFVQTDTSGTKDVNRYLNPAEFTESFGVARALVPKSDVREMGVRAGGAFRQKLDRALPDSTQLTNDGGLELVADYRFTHPSKVIAYTGRLTAYEALVRVDAPDGSDWRYPDINWENTVVVTVNRYVMFNMYVQMLYDKELDSDPRLRNTVAVGLTYAVKSGDGAAKANQTGAAQ
jgi:hypothetical protein